MTPLTLFPIHRIATSKQVIHCRFRMERRTHGACQHAPPSCSAVRPSVSPSRAYVRRLTDGSGSERERERVIERGPAAVPSSRHRRQPFTCRCNVCSGDTVTYAPASTPRGTKASAGSSPSAGLLEDRRAPTRRCSAKAALGTGPTTTIRPTDRPTSRRAKALNMAAAKCPDQFCYVRRVRRLLARLVVGLPVEYEPPSVGPSDTQAVCSRGFGGGGSGSSSSSSSTVGSPADNRHEDELIETRVRRVKQNIPRAGRHTIFMQMIFCEAVERQRRETTMTLWSACLHAFEFPRSTRLRTAARIEGNSGTFFLSARQN
jgi:hypothetical protein